MTFLKKKKINYFQKLNKIVEKGFFRKYIYIKENIFYESLKKFLNLKKFL